MRFQGQNLFESNKPKRSSASLRTLWVLFAVIFFTCSAFAVVAYFQPTNGYSRSSNFDSSKSLIPAVATTPSASTSSNLTILHSPCGSTSAEARAAGCIFDSNSFVWNHARCHNADLTAEFLTLKLWSWFTDDSRTHELTLEEVMTGDYNAVVVSMEFHVQHCLAMWRLLHAQSLGPYGRFGVDSYVGNMMHTRHCGMMMTQTEVGHEEYNTMIMVKYPDCGMDVLGAADVMKTMKMDHGHGNHSA